MNVDKTLQEHPRYSIVCTLRNNYKCFYDELLEHIEGQSERNFECIFLVDQPEVDWVNVPDSRFQVVRINQELPLAQKRNIGIQKASGDYVVFCDADDYLDKELLHGFSQIIAQCSPDLIMPQISRKQVDFIQQDAHIVDNINLIKGKNSIYEHFFSRYLCGYQLSDFLIDGCWGRAFKREILINNNIRFLEEPCRAEDALFVNDFVLCATSVYFMSDYFGYYWRINTGSEMFNVNSFFYNIVPFANKLLSQMKQVPERYSKDLYYYVSSRIISQGILFCKARYMKQISKIELKELLNRSAPLNSFCRECMNKVSWGYGGINKVLCVLYSHSLYSLFYIFFCIRQIIKK